MNIYYLVFKPASLTYTVLKALSFSGYTIFLYIADRTFDFNAAPSIVQRLLSIPCVSILVADQGTTYPSIDRCIIEATPHLLKSLADSNDLKKITQKISLITAGDRSHSWFEAFQLQRQEIWKLRHLMNNVDRIAYKDGYYQIDCYGVFKPRYVVGFDVHSQFLNDEDLFLEIHDGNWKAESKRPILVNFMGSQDPNIRRRILDSVRPFFLKQSNEADQSKAWFWHEYTDASPGGIGASEFIKTLRMSDFTLCPPGYSLVTHRPYEALLNGSIPILNSNELDLYDIGLEDGINCIAVSANNWPAVLEKLTKIDEEKILAMRNNIKLMFAELLDYESSSKRMCRRLGISSAETG